MEEASARIRLDKWLWQARFFKSRRLSAEVVAAGHVRVNSVKVARPGHRVGPGDTLTFAQARQVRVVRILAAGSRRGPASEAATLYDDLSPAGDDLPRHPGGAQQTRPDRRARREAALFKRDPLE